MEKILNLIAWIRTHDSDNKKEMNQLSNIIAQCTSTSCSSKENSVNRKRFSFGVNWSNLERSNLHPFQTTHPPLHQKEDDWHLSVIRMNLNHNFTFFLSRFMLCFKYINIINIIYSFLFLKIVRNLSRPVNLSFENVNNNNSISNII